jgi:hypothetical protein
MYFVLQNSSSQTDIKYQSRHKFSVSHLRVTLILLLQKQIPQVCIKDFSKMYWYEKLY